MTEPPKLLNAPEGAPPPPEEAPPALSARATKPAADLRTEAVGQLLAKAYERASTLELSPQERIALLAEFPDEAVERGAGGNNDLLYIGHAFIRERLLEVFGPGAFTEVVRRIWGEEFRTAKGGQATRLYADVVLLVRGCYVGEAIGAGIFYKDNANSNYSDAAESAQSEAVRRICGKKLGVGLSVWKKAWCEAWKARQNQPKRPQFDNTPRAHPVRAEAKESTEINFTGKVSSIETQETTSGKQYRVLRFEKDPTHLYSTWHRMEDVTAGDTLDVTATSRETATGPAWSIASYTRLAPNPAQDASEEAGTGEQTPETPTDEIENPLKQLRSRLKAAKIKETTLLGALAELGTAPFFESLEELAISKPEALSLALEQFDSIVQRLKDAKDAKGKK
jgi:Mitochondrial genome maintenance MGM101